MLDAARRLRLGLEFGSGGQAGDSGIMDGVGKLLAPRVEPFGSLFSTARVSPRKARALTLLASSTVRSTPRPKTLDKNAVDLWNMTEGGRIAAIYLAMTGSLGGQGRAEIKESITGAVRRITRGFLRRRSSEAVTDDA